MTIILQIKKYFYDPAEGEEGMGSLRFLSYLCILLVSFKDILFYYFVIYVSSACTYAGTAKKLLTIRVKGRVQKKCGFIHICFWPTHPPNVEKKQKKTCCFGYFLAHLEPKKILMFLPCHQLEPSTAVTHHRHHQFRGKLIQCEYPTWFIFREGFIKKK